MFLKIFALKSTARRSIEEVSQVSIATIAIVPNGENEVVDSVADTAPIAEVDQVDAFYDDNSGKCSFLIYWFI